MFENSRTLELKIDGNEEICHVPRDISFDALKCRLAPEYDRLHPEKCSLQVWHIAHEKRLNDTKSHTLISNEEEWKVLVARYLDEQFGNGMDATHHGEDYHPLRIRFHTSRWNFSQVYMAKEAVRNARATVGGVPVQVSSESREDIDETEGEVEASGQVAYPGSYWTKIFEAQRHRSGEVETSGQVAYPGSYWTKIAEAQRRSGSFEFEPTSSLDSFSSSEAEAAPLRSFNAKDFVSVVQPTVYASRFPRQARRRVRCRRGRRGLAHSGCQLMLARFEERQYDVPEFSESPSSTLKRWSPRQQAVLRGGGKTNGDVQKGAQM